MFKETPPDDYYYYFRYLLITKMEEPMGDLRSQLIPGQQSDGAVFKTVLFYSVLILLLPIASFFASKFLFFEWFLGQAS